MSNIKPELTEREKQILYAVRMIQFRFRFSPTQADLADFLGGKDKAYGIKLKALVKKGYLEVTPDRARRNRRLLFPRGITFPWNDSLQFPTDIFPTFEEIQQMGIQTYASPPPPPPPPTPTPDAAN